MEPGVASELELTATAMASDGRAVGREESGRVVFVDGALPGERVRARIGEQRPRYASGDLVEVLEASRDRVEPRCRHLLQGCGGCQWQHVDPQAQRRFKAQIILDALRRIARIEPPALRPTVELPPWSYRTTLRAGVDADGRAGLRALRSNDLVNVPDCLVIHPLLAELLADGRYLGAAEVIMRCGARTGERLVATIPSGSPPQVPVDAVRSYFHEQAAGRLWRVSARSFFQTRPDGVDALAALVETAAGETGAPARALDLYSGVGLFAGVLAARGWAVTAVEGAAASVADARRNLRDLDVRVVRADLSGWRPEQRAELVVADPSRAGLGRAGTEAVVASGAGRLVLISCDAGSLGRDAGLLRDAGYRLASVTPVDLFPHTFHVEVVTVFERT